MLKCHRIETPKVFFKRMESIRTNYFVEGNWSLQKEYRETALVNFFRPHTLSCCKVSQLKGDEVVTLLKI